jgi:hypothetical protein
MLTVSSSIEAAVADVELACSSAARLVSSVATEIWLARLASAPASRSMSAISPRRAVLHLRDRLHQTTAGQPVGVEFLTQIAGAARRFSEAQRRRQ